MLLEDQKEALVRGSDINSDIVKGKAQILDSLVTGIEDAFLQTVKEHYEGVADRDEE